MGKGSPSLPLLTIAMNLPSPSLLARKLFCGLVMGQDRIDECLLITSADRVFSPH